MFSDSRRKEESIQTIANQVTAHKVPHTAIRQAEPEGLVARVRGRRGRALPPYLRGEDGTFGQRIDATVRQHATLTFPKPAKYLFRILRPLT